jgi:hypothetical protein
MKTNKAVQLQIAEAVTTKVDCPTKNIKYHLLKQNNKHISNLTWKWEVIKIWKTEILKECSKFSFEKEDDLDHTTKEDNFNCNFYNLKPQGVKWDKQINQKTSTNKTKATYYSKSLKGLTEKILIFKKNRGIALLNLKPFFLFYFGQLHLL